MSTEKFSELEEELLFRTGFLPVLKEKRQLRTLKGKIIRKEYDVAVLLSDGKELKAETLGSINNITYSEHWDECCDAELDTKTRRSLRLCLQQQAAKMKWSEHFYIDELGLCEGVRLPYAYGKNAVIDNHTENSYLFADDLPDFHCEKRGEITGNKMDYIKNLINLKPGVTDVLFCVILLCIIRPVFLMIGCPADFFLVLYGPSGALKSTYAKLFFVEQREQMMSFTMDRSRKILDCIEKYSGHAVVVDDYHPAAKDYDRKRQDSIMDAIARNADSGYGALAVVTSEFLSGSFSLQDRMIQVHVKRLETEVAKEKCADFLRTLTDLQQNSDILREILYEFACRVYLNLDSVQKMLKGFIQNRKVENISARIERNIDYLYMAMSVFNKMFLDYNLKEFDGMISSSLNSLKYTQLRHMGMIKRLEADQDWTDEVFRMLDTEEIKKCYGFEKKQTGGQEIVIHNSKVYITPYTLEMEMQKYLKMRINIKDIVSHLSKTQVLDEDNSSSYTMKRNGKRYYVIDRSRLELHHLKKNPEDLKVNTQSKGIIQLSNKK